MRVNKSFQRKLSFITSFLLQNKQLKRHLSDFKQYHHRPIFFVTQSVWFDKILINYAHDKAIIRPLKIDYEICILPLL